MTNHTTTAPDLNLDSLAVLSPLGRGAKGVVFKVRDEPSGELWALKVIWRELVEKKKNVNECAGNDYKRISLEQEVLSRFNHPLLPRLRGVLETPKIVAYAMDYCPGRDLNYLRKQQSEKMFSVDVIRFYASEVVLALDYLHSIGIAYRDLKPENILIQENGHIMLVDFDLSTKLPPISRQASPIKPPSPGPLRRKRRSLWCLGSSNSGITPEESSKRDVPVSRTTPSETDSSEKSNSFVGTEEYVAPEIIHGHGHDFSVDWWSLGIVMYEMLYGVTPFKGENRKETFFRILTKAPELVGEATPLRDLIGKLLNKDPKQRIRLEEIKGHEFFKGVNWERVVDIVRPPYIPRTSVWEEEGKVGIKEIDVECFVRGIFEERISSNSNNNDNDEKSRKEEWVKALHNHPCDSGNFLVF